MVRPLLPEFNPRERASPTIARAANLVSSLGRFDERDLADDVGDVAADRPADEAMIARGDGGLLIGLALRSVSTMDRWAHRDGRESHRARVAGHQPLGTYRETGLRQPGRAQHLCQRYAVR